MVLGNLLSPDELNCLAKQRANERYELIADDLAHCTFLQRATLKDAILRDERRAVLSEHKAFQIIQHHADDLAHKASRLDLDNRKLDLSERKFAFHQQTTRQQPPAPEPSPAPEPFMFDYQALSREPKRKVISLSRTPYSSQS